jgi:hypothetical protein
MCEKMKYQKKILLGIGQLSLFIGFILFLTNYFVLDNNLFIALFIGILFGLALVLNLSYLLTMK